MQKRSFPNPTRQGDYCDFARLAESGPDFCPNHSVVSVIWQSPDGAYVRHYCAYHGHIVLDDTYSDQDILDSRGILTLRTEV